MRQLLTRIRKASSKFTKSCPRQIENPVSLDKPVLVNSGSRSIRQPIIVYQMGKVGSSSIAEALLAVGRRVFHVHVLNAEKLLTIAKRHEEQEIDLPVHIRRSYKAKELFLDKGLPVKIITAVRDPIARNISAYFQTLRFFRLLKPELEEDELQTMMTEFLEKYWHNFPLTWFDREIKVALGVDVYNYPFPENDGVQRIQENGRDILLLKAESADHLKVAALREFLQIPEFSLDVKNVGEEKAYAHYYKPFLERIQLPAAYIDKMYESRYARHFYTPEEIHQFRQRWTRNRMSSERESIAQKGSRGVGNDEQIQQSSFSTHQEKPGSTPDAAA